VKFGTHVNLGLCLPQGHMKKLQLWAHTIRQFILNRVINGHRDRLLQGAPPADFTDALLQHLESDPDLTWQHAIFELEDFLGGHSAVGNLIMLILAVVVKYPEVSTRFFLSVLQQCSSILQQISYISFKWESLAFLTGVFCLIIHFGRFERMQI